MAKKRNAVKPAVESDIDLPIEYVFPENHVPVIANQAGIHRTPAEVSLMFFFARPPLFSGEPDEIEKRVAGLKHIDARCVAEVVMHPVNFSELCTSQSTDA